MDDRICMTLKSIPLGHGLPLWVDHVLEGYFLSREYVPLGLFSSITRVKPLAEVSCLTLS